MIELIGDLFKYHAFRRLAKSTEVIQNERTHKNTLNLDVKDARYGKPIKESCTDFYYIRQLLLFCCLVEAFACR